eukprot:SAG31_NODE_714_length_12645_cov_15.347760_8_plen_518_part_00
MARGGPTRRVRSSTAGRRGALPAASTGAMSRAVTPRVSSPTADGLALHCLSNALMAILRSAAFQWHLISSFYDYLPWARDGVAVANEPWSGRYEITAPTWSLAHTSQFNPPGWRMLSHGSGVEFLAGGGSLVTRISPDSKDFSAVIEKMTTQNSLCARGANPPMLVSAETVTLTLKGALLAASKARGLHVWYSNLSSSNDAGRNPPEGQLFQKLGTPPPVDSSGSMKLQVHPEEIYTITTLHSGHKGTASPSPPAQPFPLPFRQDFDHEAISAPPAFWYDQMGAWEVQADADPRQPGNRLMRQVAPVWPECWGYQCTGPHSYFGPKTFNASGPNGFRISIDVRLESDAIFAIGGSKVVECPLCLRLDSKNGTFRLGNQSGAAKFSTGSIHKVVLVLKTNSMSASLNGIPLVDRSGEKHCGIEDGFFISMSLDRYVYADVDNFEISASAVDFAPDSSTPGLKLDDGDSLFLPMYSDTTAALAIQRAAWRRVLFLITACARRRSYSSIALHRQFAASVE